MHCWDELKSLRAQSVDEVSAYYSCMQFSGWLSPCLLVQLIDFHKYLDCISKAADFLLVIKTMRREPSVWLYFLLLIHLWNCQFSYNHWLVTIKLLSVKHPFQPLQGIFQATSLFSWGYIPVIIKGKMSYILSWVTVVEETKASNVILNTTQFSTSHKFMTRLAFFCNFICLYP